MPKTTAHMCQYNMKVHQPSGKALFVKKPTCLLHRFDVHSIGVRERERNGDHIHATLRGGFPRSGPPGSMKAAQKYTPELCRAVCKGFIQKKNNDAKGLLTTSHSNEARE